MQEKYTWVNLLLCCVCLPSLLVLSICQSKPSAQSQSQAPTIASAPDSTATSALHVPNHELAATLLSAAMPSTQPVANSAHPVLAFYYPWYNTSSWNPTSMSDLPAIIYNSSDDVTIDRHINWAANAGITGFISSWWGPGDQTDTNFAQLLAHSAALEHATNSHFASSLYFECDAPKLSGTTNIIQSLQYLVAHYSNNSHFFHWQGKPVIFFWDPLGNGRTLSQWASIRSQVDPNNQTVWSAEGVDTTLLNVFDGIHLFSGGYWGFRKNNHMTAVDQGFRAQVDAYNSANGTHKIWAAGVIPGYDDTRIPGRKGTYIVPRNNGATYNSSWTAAIASNPEWITITSFNEWFEGSMIEPSVSYNTLYLDMTQKYTRQW